MTLSLFADSEEERPWREELCSGAVVLRRFAVSDDRAIFAALLDVIERPISSHGHTRRFPDVGGDEQLWFVWLGDRLYRLPI